MSPTTRILTAVAIALLTAPATASAAGLDIAAGALRYGGGPERNNLQITFVGGAYIVTDNPGVAISAASGCTNPEADNTATCTGTVNRLEVDAAGESDFVDLDDPALPAFTNISELDGGSGDDVILGTRGPDNLRGGDGDDFLEGGPGSDWSFGGEGEDSTSFGNAPGPVTVDMTAGTNTDGPAPGGDDANRDGTVEGVYGSEFADTLTGTGGDEKISGEGGTDTITGLGGNDVLDGGNASDTITAGPGNDRVEGGSDPVRDVMDGGTGHDVMSYADHFGPVRAALTGGSSQGSTGEDDSLVAFESLEGGPGDDVLTGDGGENQLLGGRGDDTLDGGLSNDFVVGQDGDDTTTYATRTEPVTVSLTTGFFPGGGQEGEFDFVLAESIEGGRGNDTLTGDVYRNVLTGGPGADVLNGLAGDDELRGGAGADSVDAGGGDDTVRVRDDEADTVACGDDSDLVLADPVDSLDGCEGIDSGPRAATPPAAPPQAPGTPADTTGPRLSVARIAAKSLKRNAFLKGLPLSLSCDESCSLDVELRGTARSVRLARYEVTLAQRSLRAGSGSRTLTLKPSRKLVGKAKRLTVQLRVTATDAAGNRSTVTRVLKVR